MGYNKKEKKLAEKKVKNSHIKKKLFVILFIIVLIVSIFVAGYFFISYFNKQNSDPAGNTQVTRSEYIKKVSEDAKRLTIANDHKGAVKVYEDAIKGTEDTEVKQTLLLMEATTHANSGDNDAALVSALASELLNNNSGTEQYIALLYERKNDKSNAIIYYKKAIENIDKEDLMANSDIEYYKNKIKLLGGY